MRYAEIINETAPEGSWKPSKFWYHAPTGRVINVDFFDRHINVAKRYRRRMGLPVEHEEFAIAAVENGWVRVSNARESDDQPHGYVTARSLADARAALRWMQGSGALSPSMDVETYQNGKPDAFFTLRDMDAVERFIRRGVQPR